MLQSTQAGLLGQLPWDLPGFGAAQLDTSPVDGVGRIQAWEGGSHGHLSRTCYPGELGQVCLSLLQSHLPAAVPRAAALPTPGASSRCQASCHLCKARDAVRAQNPAFPGPRPSHDSGGPVRVADSQARVCHVLTHGPAPTAPRLLHALPRSEPGASPRGAARSPPGRQPFPGEDGSGAGRLADLMGVSQALGAQANRFRLSALLKGCIVGATSRLFCWEAGPGFDPSDEAFSSAAAPACPASPLPPRCSLEPAPAVRPKGEAINKELKGASWHLRVPPGAEQLRGWPHALPLPALSLAGFSG